MKYFLVSILGLLIACNKQSTHYSHTIVENEKLHIEALKSINKQEKILLLGYLAIYGNECVDNSDKIKCKILKELQIKDECNFNNKKLLKKWFKTDVIKSIKLKNCPNLPFAGAIQNRIKKLIIAQNQDTIQITIRVVGMNTSQEKNWDIEQIERFLIKNNTFIKIY